MIRVEGRDKFSTRLRVKVQLAFSNPFGGQRSLEAEKDCREHFKDYLFAVHSIIRASVPLMTAAENECLQLREDQLCSALTRYYHEHAIEELNHDQWLLSDLEAIGVSRERVLSRKPTQAVAELVGSQYYWIHHWHPVCLLGYIAVLEGYPPQQKDLEVLRIKTGYPRAAFRTLAEHSFLDTHHIEVFDSTLDRLPLNERHEEWITLNAIYTVKKCAGILDSDWSAMLHADHIAVAGHPRTALDLGVHKSWRRHRPLGMSTAKSIRAS